jgi:hypothetical protein
MKRAAAILLLVACVLAAAWPQAAEDRIEVYRDEKTGEQFIRLDDARRLVELMIQQAAEIRRLKQGAGCT